MGAKERTAFDWQFWFQWIVVTTMGWVLGTFLIPPIDLALSGIAIGAGQWVILQRRISRSPHWILASVLGWMAGWALTLAAVPADFGLLAGLVLGGSAGTAQWLVLRRQVHWAGWWVIVSALAWATGLGVTPGFMMSGVLAGAITGLVLDLLLRNPKRTEQPDRTGEAP